MKSENTSSQTPANGLTRRAFVKAMAATAVAATGTSCALNAKVQRPSVCNAVETILVHERIAPRFLPLFKREFDACGVKIISDAKTAQLLPGTQRAKNATGKRSILI